MSVPYYESVNSCFYIRIYALQRSGDCNRGVTRIYKFLLIDFLGPMAMRQPILSNERLGKI